uniref:NADH-ubiquinone oxidoreductase chain 4 n=1 Tax=Ixodes ricinus TaxID=34613 RepID=V5HBM1_IXORI
MKLIQIRYIIIVISVLGSMIVGVICLFQTDIKSLIAYSSVCHIGIVLRGIIRINFLRSFGSLLLILGHGLCSSGLFCLGNI